MPTNVRDPRTLITPDAFGIAPDLLGTPLALPRRRLWAMLIDLVVIGLLTAMFDGIAIFIWGAVGLFLLKVTFEKPTGRSQVVSRLLRLSTGCLGFLILSGVAIAGLVIAGSGGGNDDDDESGLGLGDVLSGFEGLDAIVQGASPTGALAVAEDAEAAEEAALQILGAMRDLPLTSAQRLELLEGLTPSEDAPWANEAGAVYRRALSRWEESTGLASPVAELGPAALEVAEMEDGEVLEAYARILLNDPPAAGLDVERTRALRARAILLLAADTLETLDDRVADLQDDLAEETSRRTEAEAAAAGGGSAFVGLVRDIWQQLGSAIGLWSIYFTIFLTLFKGQTIGKRFVGVRVVRLDGEPITWWAAFERGGGYIAGLATGLLGFVQIFWDNNRQCIHDKIVGTVVVDDRADKLPGAWEQAAGHSGEPRKT